MKYSTLHAGLMLLLLAVSTSAPAGPITGDRAYLFSAARYLNIQKEQGIRVRQALAALDAQQANDADFRATVTTALAITKEEWSNNYLKSEVPVAHAEIAQHLELSHDLREAAYRQWLESPKDQDPISVADSTESFRASLNEEEQALDDLMSALQKRR